MTTFPDDTNPNPAEEKMLPNRVTLAELPQLPVGEIAALPAEQIALLVEEASGALAQAKRLKDRLDGALELKYRDRAAERRAADGKDSGTIRFEDGQVLVTADLPKKVDWDQERLKGLAIRLGSEGEDPEEYIEVTYRVPERRYTAWPQYIRDLFTPARTVRTGKPSFKLAVSRAEEVR